MDIKQAKQELNREFGGRVLSASLMIEIIERYMELLKQEEIRLIAQNKQLKQKNDICPTCKKPRNFDKKNGYETCKHCGEDCPF